MDIQVPGQDPQQQDNAQPPTDLPAEPVTPQNPEPQPEPQTPPAIDQEIPSPGMAMNENAGAAPVETVSTVGTPEPASQTPPLVQSQESQPATLQPEPQPSDVSPSNPPADSGGPVPIPPASMTPTPQSSTMAGSNPAKKPSKLFIVGAGIIVLGLIGLIVFLMF